MPFDASPPPGMSLGMNIIDLGAHTSAWRLGERPAGAYLTPAYYTELAQLSERGKLDAVFLADIPAVMGSIAQAPVGRLEPTVLLATLAAATRHIGLIATASTSYNEPYNLARRIASLDIVSGGRAAWNAVTTIGDAAAQNFGLDGAPQHGDRYGRAAEFVDAVLALWDSWEDGAIVGDLERGVFGDPARVHPARHAGTHFRVQGALNVPRTPQGRPVLVQAGASARGKDLGARQADVIFTSQTTLAGAQAFYREMKERARTHGRDPQALRIMPGLSTVIGGTEEIGRAHV